MHGTQELPLTVCSAHSGCLASFVEDVNTQGLHTRRIHNQRTPHDWNSRTRSSKR